jgi:hypothetical protein
LAFAGFNVTPAAAMRDELARLRVEIDRGNWPPAGSAPSSSAVLALEAIRTFNEFDIAIETGVELMDPVSKERGPVRLLVARAIVAGWIAEEMKSGAPSVPAAERDEMQRLACELLSGAKQAKGLAGDIVGLLTKPLAALLRVTLLDPLWQGAAAGGRAYRHTIAQGATPAVGDILLYQARGEKIRALIASAIDDASKEDDAPVLLLAHSLGGIACIDLLIATAQLNVKGIITVGSQAPFLYEIGALTELEAPAELPSHMPAWLNIFDRDDLLSFKAVPIMKGGNGVEDSEIRSHQPFPAAHGAYWSNPPVWERIKAFVESIHL